MKSRSRRQFPARPAGGFGLVELMVALVLGLLLIAAAVHVFLGNRASHRYNQSLATLQDNARFVFHALGRDLRMAGYSGCADPATTAPSVRTFSPYGNLEILATSTNVSGPEFFEDALARPGSGLPGSANSTSDALRLSYMRDHDVRLTGTAGSPSGDLQVSGNPAGWESGDQLLVTDCRNADLFTATHVTGSSIAHDATDSDGTSKNERASLSKLYDSEAQVYEPYGVIYYVADTQQKDGEGNAIPALYRKQVAPLVKNGQALVNGISHLTVRYGINASGGPAPENYVPSDGVSDWGQVVAVRIGFVADSMNRAGTGTGVDVDRERTIFGRTLTELPDDGHLRRVFTTTIALRNQIP